MQRQYALQAVAAARTRLREAAEEARPRIEEISAEEADRRISAGAVLIDVRFEREFRARHLPGAIRIGWETLAAEIAGRVPDRSTPIVCYCSFGPRSLIAADTLRQLGYRAVAALAGGLQAYSAHSGPSLSTARIFDVGTGATPPVFPPPALEITPKQRAFTA